MRMLKKQGNVFLTGAAGTGKSYLLSQYLSLHNGDDITVVASTGAAAVIVGGRTFHSFFGLGIMEGGVEMTVLRALKSKPLIRRMKKAHTVIIDEISMLSGATLHAAEQIARRARAVQSPWGGLRIIAVGDFAQLPPISKEDTVKDWAFLSDTWAASAFSSALLTTVMRTQDAEFLRILSDVRRGITSDDVRSFLEAHTDESADTLDGTRLYPHRAQADAYNQQKLTSINAPLKSFHTEYTGDESYFGTAQRAFPIPPCLHLKRGALIMMRKNDVMGRYVNGSLGFVGSLDEESIEVQLMNGATIEVSKEQFSYVNGDGRELVSAWNFPVTLAWASTIHKAQGASLDRIIVDLHALWEPGQAYVALSRVRSGDGLVITRWHPSSIRAEPLVTALYESLSRASARVDIKKSTDVIDEEAPQETMSSASIPTADIRCTIGQSSLGYVLVACSDKGIVAVALGDTPEILRREFLEEYPSAIVTQNDDALQKMLASVLSFLREPRMGIDVPLDIRGSDFQKNVWRALRSIPVGKKTSYAEIARIIGKPTAARAIAKACASNRIALLIPCHRVIHKDGTHAGYRWGAERKAMLLAKEEASVGLTGE